MEGIYNERFDEMEKELYKLDAYLEEDRLKEKISEKQYDYLSYDDFYFKQPEDKSRMA